MTARADILANIRRSLGVAASERMRVQAVEDRIERSPRGVIPARGQVDPVARRDLFKAQAEGVQATVEVVANAKDVPKEIGRAHV